MDPNANANANDAGTSADGGRTDGDGPGIITSKPRPPGCPSVAPSGGDPCAPAGIQCDYSAEEQRCGTYLCDSGRWISAPGSGCAPPPGITCPVPATPYVGGPSAPIDKSCDAQDECVLVTLQTDCCGNTLSYAVNKASARAAEAYATMCKRTFPGCGCPSGPTVAESGSIDGGPSTIVAVCTSNGCLSKYVHTP